MGSLAAVPKEDAMDPKDCILYSGAAPGAEAAFGAAAERHGMEEVNFSFEGHNDARRRGIRILTHEELAQGDVSLQYVSRLMERSYPDTRLFKKVLQTIWHQVNNGQEIYVVGKVLPNGTVKGGTGWGAEFAKLCNKPLFVFDQERDAWFHWRVAKFEPGGEPRIQHPHFCGTGTRFLAENGQAAVDALFERSFGA
jgi:ribosomal protein L20A (L18A)